MSEVWRAIPKAPGFEVSSQGHVRHGDRLVSRSKSKDGYWRVNLIIDGKWRMRNVSRLMCLAFHGEPPSPTHQAAHDDGVGTNDVLSNLFWKTPKQNVEDRERHGNTPRGERCGLSKLTEQDVQNIRATWIPGRGRWHRGNARELAETYGVSMDTIWQAARGKTWNHAEGHRPAARAPNGGVTSQT